MRTNCTSYHPYHRTRPPLPLPFFIGRVPAGFPSPADDYVDAPLDLNDLITHPAATFFVRVSGDSMVGAGILDGAILVVDRALKPSPGRVVIAMINGETTVKRLERRADGWWLHPDNPAYTPQPLPKGAEIWGVVIHAINAL